MTRMCSNCKYYEHGDLVDLCRHPAVLSNDMDGRLCPLWEAKPSRVKRFMWWLMHICMAGVLFFSAINCVSTRLSREFSDLQPVMIIADTAAFVCAFGGNTVILLDR